MTIEKKWADAQKKIKQYEHQKILQKNRTKESKANIDLRRKILIGEMFLKHFPIALKFTPGNSSDEDAKTFEPLDDFMESMSRCQQAFHSVEDTLL